MILHLLRSGEKTLISEEDVESAVVEDADDGGMGSITFLQAASTTAAPAARRLGKLIAERQYIDADGIPVVFALSLDQDGNLFELDAWKVDFSPLKRYPTPSDLEEFSWTELPRRQPKR